MRRLTKFVKSALKDIFANRARSFLTILGILIGIASVTLMVSIGGSAKLFISDSITTTLGKNTVIVQPGGSSSSSGISFNAGAVLSSLTDKEYNAVKNWNDPDLAYVARRSAASLKLRLGTTEADSIAIVIDPEIFKIVDFPLVEGRYLRIGSDGSRDIVINQSISNKFFKLQDPIGQMINVQGFDFKIVGVTQDAAGAVLGETLQCFIDIDTYRQLFRKPEAYQALATSVKDGADITAFKQRLENLLRAERGLLASEKSDFSITTQGDIVQTTNTVLGTVTLFITVISAISLLVGGVGIMNIMLVSVRERVKEFGLRKAVGATNLDIQTQILIESVLFSLLGGLFGIVVGAIGAFGVEKLGGLPLFISSGAVFASIGVSSSVGIIFGLYPAIQAGKLSPIEALRSN